MGRKSKGPDRADEAKHITYKEIVELGLLHKHPYSVERQKEWRTDNKFDLALIESTYDPVKQTNLIRISYLEWNENGIPKHEETLIEIEQIASNLGKGKVGYFICPSTGNKCRILYKTEKSKKWQCRKAFEGKLYYPLQLCSKLNSFTERNKAYNLWISKYKEKRFILKYKGTFTKRHDQLRKLKDMEGKMFSLIWSPLSYPLQIRKLMPPGLEDSFRRLHCNHRETDFDAVCKRLSNNRDGLTGH